MKCTDVTAMYASVHVAVCIVFGWLVYVGESGDLMLMQMYLGTALQEEYHSCHSLDYGRVDVHVYYSQTTPVIAQFIGDGIHWTISINSSHLLNQTAG